jgi:hypothetical protein
MIRDRSAECLADGLPARILRFEGYVACEGGFAARKFPVTESSGYVSAAATTVGVITCRAKLRARACSGVAAERTTSGLICEVA